MTTLTTLTTSDYRGGRSSACGKLRGGAAQLLVERDERQLERLDRVGRPDDVVAEAEHRQLVARHGCAGQPLEQRRLELHDAERHVHRRTACAECPFQPIPEL